MVLNPAKTKRSFAPRTAEGGCPHILYGWLDMGNPAQGSPHPAFYGSNDPRGHGTEVSFE
jgi:hypothetical protein